MASTIIPRGKLISISGRDYLGSALALSFVCAVCGSRLVHLAHSDSDEYYCAQDKAHNSIVTQSVYERWENEQFVEKQGVENARRANLLRVARQNFPEVAQVLDQHLDQVGEMLYPEDEGI